MFIISENSNQNCMKFFFLQQYNLYNILQFFLTLWNLKCSLLAHEFTQLESEPLMLKKNKKNLHCHWMPRKSTEKLQTWTFGEQKIIPSVVRNLINDFDGVNWRLFCAANCLWPNSQLISLTPISSSVTQKPRFTMFYLPKNTCFAVGNLWMIDAVMIAWIKY